MIEITDDDRTVWRGLPYRHNGVCATCEAPNFVAGTTRRKMRCLVCFAKTRHRRLGQLRARSAQTKGTP